MSAPFPEAALRLVRELPGNSKCCDCSSISAEWASVSHGTVLCLECAGRHRALGVQVSFVRSLLMDSWTAEQVETMRQGGNQQIRNFFAKMNVENSPVETLYRTKAAAYYREKLKERVQKVLAGEISGERRTSPKPEDKAAHKHDKPSHSQPQQPQQQLHPVFGRRKMTQLQVQFGDGPMGMSITKDGFGQAQVTRLVPGGAAQQQGIRVGDYIVGVAGKNVGGYDEVMALIPVLPRPLRLLLFQPIHEEAKKPATPATPERPVPPTTASKSANKQRVAVVQNHHDEEDEDDDANGVPASATRKLVRKSSQRHHKRSEDGSAASVEHAATADGHDNEAQEAEEEEEGKERAGDDGRQETVEENGNGNGSEAHDVVDDEDDEVDDEEDEDDDDEEEEEEEEEADVEEEVVIDIQPGMTIKVWCEAKDKYRTAVVKRKHRDDTYKVVFRDGSSESHVSLDRIAITRDVLERQQSHASMSSMQSAFAAVTFQGSAAAATTTTHAQEENDEEQPAADPSEFVVRPDEDIEQWIEADDVPQPPGVAAAAVVTRPTVAAEPSPTAAEPRVLGKDFRVVFQAGPMGFTLTKDGSGRAVVTKIQPRGQAEHQGLKIGDIVVGVGSQWMHGYDEVMACIPQAPRPVTLVIRRKTLESVSSATVVVPDSIVGPSNRVKAPAKMSASTANAIVGGHDAATRRATAAVFSHLVDQEDYRARTMTTRRELEEQPEPGEFDVDFKDGDLGLRLEERGGVLPVSVVTFIAPEGQAEAAGVTIGCTIIGVNGERFISHAHTVSTLRHAKRPVRVRFRHCDR